jgi:ornithine cyclodeaminase/alanine dehydrogenase-like protein (mu-crystallin family)
VLNFVNSSCNELGTDFTPRGLGEVIVEGSGRESQSDVICYFSVGLGIQDAAIVEIVLEKLGS